jgi:hypothetical protein
MDIPIHKTIRKMLVNDCINNLRKSGLPDKTLGFLLKSLHFHTPWYHMIYFMVLPKPFALLALIPLLMAFVLFMYLDGCFLTIVEYKLCQNDLNIIDPYILLGGDEITPTTRYWYTMAIAIIYFIIAFLILYFRGCFKWKIFSEFKISL